MPPTLETAGRDLRQVGKQIIQSGGELARRVDAATATRSRWPSVPFAQGDAQPTEQSFRQVLDQLSKLSQFRLQAVQSLRRKQKGVGSVVLEGLRGPRGARPSTTCPLLP